MSSVPAVLRNKLLQLAIGFAAGAATYMAVEQSPSQEVQLAMEIGAHYESSGRHIGKPYVDKLGKGQPLTVCNGVTGPEVVAGRYYTPDDCKRLELPKYLAAEKAAMRLFTRWGSYNIWVRASIIDMIYNLGEATVAASTLRAQANAGADFEVWVVQPWPTCCWPGRDMPNPMLGIKKPPEGGWFYRGPCYRQGGAWYSAPWAAI